MAAVGKHETGEFAALLQPRHGGKITINSVHRHGEGWVVLFKTVRPGQRPAYHVASVAEWGGDLVIRLEFSVD